MRTILHLVPRISLTPTHFPDGSMEEMSPPGKRGLVIFPSDAAGAGGAGHPCDSRRGTRALPGEKR
jgi:hypothetical protein